MPTITASEIRDPGLRQQVLDALRCDPAIAAAVCVSVANGIVTLRGVATNREQHLRAERLVRSVRGVRAVVNNIEVKQPTRLTPRDQEIAEAAANALIWYRAVPPNTVQVAVRDGWVTLTGVVSRISERGAAERAIRRLRGVRGISNAVAVSDAPEERRTTS